MAEEARACACEGLDCARAIRERPRARRAWIAAARNVVLVGPGRHELTAALPGRLARRVDVLVTRGHRDRIALPSKRKDCGEESVPPSP